MLEKKPIRKPALKHGCETCSYRASDLEVNEEEPSIIRCYCKARFIKVDSTLMAQDCDFFKLSQEIQNQKREDNKYGL